MSKYTPLRNFLAGQQRDLIPLSFGEIEEILKFSLPRSKRYPAWWSNNPSNNPMTREWLDAGFETEAVNTVGEKLVFRRAQRLGGFREEALTFNGESQGASDLVVAPRGADPLFGCMAGTLTLLPEVDYTAPADPDWGKVYDD